MTESRFARFLVDRLEAKVGELPESETRDEVLIYVCELRGLVDVEKTQGDTPAPRRGRSANA